MKDDRHLEYWISQPVDVYLVIRQTDELSGQQVIRWMNVTRYLKARKDKEEPTDHLRRGEARHGGGVEGAGRVLSAIESKVNIADLPTILVREEALRH